MQTIYQELLRAEVPGPRDVKGVEKENRRQAPVLPENLPDPLRSKTIGPDPEVPRLVCVKPQSSFLTAPGRHGCPEVG